MRFAGSGSVGKKDLSFDGKSWEYRHPDNDSGAIDPQGRGIDTRATFADYYKMTGKNIPQNLKYNKNSLDFLDPLYDYSKGDVSDAAKKLGIGNIDEKAEVKAILEEIRKPKNEQEKIITKYIEKDEERNDGPEIPDAIAVVDPHDPVPEVDLQDTDNIYTEGVTPITEGGIGGGGNLNPMQQVVQANPVTTEIEGDDNKVDNIVDNSVNQTTTDASDNRRYYGGQSNVFRYATNIPNSYGSTQTEMSSPFGEGFDFMNSPSNAQKILASKMGDLMFGRKRMFG